MEKQVIVITGGSAGVGRATAIEFAKLGNSIALLARDEARLYQAVEEVRKNGGKGKGFVCDVADFQQVEKVASRVEEVLGPIDIWINNATATVFSPIKDITPEEFKRVTEVTYLGTVYGTKAALKRMLPRNKGTIIQVGSALSYRSIPLQSAYSASKHAIRAFTDALRVELVHEKSDIYLTMVQLPTLNTPQFSWSRTHIDMHPQPVLPIFQPEVAAKAILWATNHRRREIWVGKPSLAIIFMNKLFPDIVDKYLETTSFDSQFVDIPLEENIPGNLFKPVKGNYSAHGIFDDKARNFSFQFELEKIPLLHYLTNLILALFAVLGLIPQFLLKLIEKSMQKSKVYRRRPAWIQ